MFVKLKREEGAEDAGETKCLGIESSPRLRFTLNKRLPDSSIMSS